EARVARRRHRTIDAARGYSARGLTGRRRATPLWLRHRGPRRRRLAHRRERHGTCLPTSDQSPSPSLRTDPLATRRLNLMAAPIANVIPLPAAAVAAPATRTNATQTTSFQTTLADATAQAQPATPTATTTPAATTDDQTDNADTAAELAGTLALS